MIVLWWVVGCGGDDPTGTSAADVVEGEDTGDVEDTDTEPVDRDADGDGADAIAAGGEDCDDDDPNVHPDADEVCNGTDDDCDGDVDDDDPSLLLSTASDWYPDLDGDTFGRAGGPFRTQCAAIPDAAANDGDCDDTNDLVNPDAPEVCNGIDDDCDVQIDDEDPGVDLATATTWYPDEDRDGAGDDLGAVVLCDPPAGAVAVGGDCDDTNRELTDPQPWVLDLDADGYGSGLESAASCTPPSAGYVLTSIGLDCDDGDPAVHPDAEDPCDDGQDLDCDGSDCQLCTEIVVGVLPGWGTTTNGYLAFGVLNADSSAFGECPVRFVDVPAGFTLVDLLGAGLNVLWLTDPGGVSLVYDAGEEAAIRDFTTGGHGGVVVSYLLSFQGFENSVLADLVGVDPGTVVDTAVATYGQLTALDPIHPLLVDVPSPFGASSYLVAQSLSVPWTGAVLPGAEVVASSTDGFNVVVAYEGAGWNGVWFSTYAEYEVASPDTLQLLYNAAFWAGGFEG